MPSPFKYKVIRKDFYSTEYEVIRRHSGESVGEIKKIGRGSFLSAGYIWLTRDDAARKLWELHTEKRTEETP